MMPLMDVGISKAAEEKRQEEQEGSLGM